MVKLHVSPEAQCDLREIKKYIMVELENPTSTVNTVSKITKAIRRLADFPDSGAPLSSILDVPRDYRFLVCGNYLVFYRHEGIDVYVARILYGRRDYMAILFSDVSKNDPEQA